MQATMNANGLQRRSSQDSCIVDNTLRKKNPLWYRRSLRGNSDRHRHNHGSQPRVCKVRQSLQSSFSAMPCKTLMKKQTDLSRALVFFHKMQFLQFGKVFIHHYCFKGALFCFFLYFLCSQNRQILWLITWIQKGKNLRFDVHSDFPYFWLQTLKMKTCFTLQDRSCIGKTR